MRQKIVTRCIAFLLLLCVLLSAVSCIAEGERQSTQGEPTGTKLEPQQTEQPPTPTPTRKRVALTFDDGPHNIRTTQIVDELTKYGWHATFFVIGNRVDGGEYNGKKGLLHAAEAGNEIAIHGYTHSVYYDKCSEETFRQELSNTEAAICDALPGQKVRLMRPVGGRITESRAAECGYASILWNVDSEDWMYKYQKGDSDEVCAGKVNTIVENVMSKVEEGDIILMHDIYESTYDAVKVILKRLWDAGFEVVTVSELFGGTPAAGQIYKYLPVAKG